MRHTTAERSAALQNFGIQLLTRRSAKHYFDFKYKRHVKVFDGYGDNAMEMRKFLDALHREKAAGKFYQIMQPRTFTVADSTNRRQGSRVCYSVRYYTRQLIGPKQAQAA